MEGVGGLQDGAGLALRQGAQADPVGQVGVETAQLPTFDPLAGQHQVHPDGTSDASDGQEQLDEVGAGGQQLTELVDDDQQVRERGQTQLGSFGAQRPVGGDVGDVSGVTQHLLASLHFTRQAGVDAFDEAGVVGQVRDDARDLGCAVEGSEGGAAFVVDEHHRQVLRVVAEQQTQHQGAQHLALAGSGCTDAQAVRSHAVLGGLLEVEGHRFTGVVGSDADPQEPGLTARCPGLGEIDVVVVGHSQQLSEVHSLLGGVVFMGVGGQTQRAEDAGQRRRRAGVEVVEFACDDLGGGIWPGIAFDDELCRGRALADPHGDRTRLGPAVIQEVDDRGGHLRQLDLGIRGRECGCRLAVLVDEDEDATVVHFRVGEQRSAGLGSAGGAGIEFGSQHAAQPRDARHDDPSRPERARNGLRRELWQPREPVPLGATSIVDHQCEVQVLG